MIKSVYNDDEKILQSILDLHCSTDIELDPTYSVGNFYKRGIVAPTHKFDISPSVEGVVEADCRALPLTDQSITTMVFDPPFLATTGPSLKKKDQNNQMVQRFGHCSNEKELHQMYVDSLREFYRILKPNGVLIFKCQDKVSSGKQYFSHVFIMNEAVKLGFYTLDMFLKVVKYRMVAAWQLKNQKHARKYHSYFIVFKKCNKIVAYM